MDDLASLGHLDQYHYLGTQACDTAIQLLGLTPASHVLDVGSGIGGPARYFASHSGCKVTGIELQPGINTGLYYYSQHTNNTKGRPCIRPEINLFWSIRFQNSNQI